MEDGCHRLTKYCQSSGVYRQRLETVPDGILVPAFPSVTEFIEAYQSVLAFPFIDTLTVIDSIEEKASKVVEKREEKNTRKDEERYLWRRSSALNTRYFVWCLVEMCERALRSFQIATARFYRRALECWLAASD